MSHQDFARFFEQAPDMLCITDVEGRLIQVNAAFERLLGWNRADLLGRGFDDMIHPDDLPATRRGLEALPERGGTLGFVARYRTATGAYRAIEWNVTHDPDTGRRYGIGRDLTDAEAGQTAMRTALEHEREIARALRVSESRLIAAQHLAMIGSWEADRTTGDLWWSDEVYRIFEVDPTQAPDLSVTFWERVYPADRALVRNTLVASVEQKTIYTLIHRLLMPDGRIKYVREQGRTIYDPTGAPLRTLGIVQDVTAWKEADAALALSHARFEAALEGVIAGFFILDSEWRYSFINSVGAHLVNRTREQLQGKVIWEEFPAAVGTTVYQVYHDVMETRQPRVFHEQFAPLDSWFEVHVFPYVGGISVFFLDTTERRRAEQALQLKDQAIASALNAIVITDATNRLIYANPAFLRLWGYNDEHEVLGRSPLDFAEPTTAQALIDRLRAYGAWQGELTATRKDGTSFDALISANTVYDAQGNICNLVASILDVSESKRLQAQFVQAQKMESVGRLAGGVAHDFNNLLTVIKGYISLALQALDPHDTLFHDLSQVDVAVDSAAGLTQQLLAFSRRQIIAPQVINLNDVLLRVQRMLQRLLGEDIELRLALQQPLAAVLFDPTQCEQIVINLAINARDAMPNGGKLTIETAEVYLDEAYARYHAGVRPGAYVLLAISDSGTGMSAEVQSHLFEPFFTTKEVGKGTGLGLAMVYGAVSQNHGRIEVYSEPGQGTTFKIYLPCTSASASRLLPRLGEALPRGNQTIVVVEDDPQVRALTTRLLEEQGYSLYAFADGAAALEAWPSLPEPIDLLITDVIMPEMNGRVLADQLRALRPGLKVLFTSGYTTDMIVTRGVLQEGVAFLSKPYTITALAQLVRDVLAQPPPDAA
jgi:PAS domain S-box-containing protein